MKTVLAFLLLASPALAQGIDWSGAPSGSAIDWSLSPAKPPTPVPVVKEYFSKTFNADNWKSTSCGCAFGLPCLCDLCACEDCHCAACPGDKADFQWSAQYKCYWNQKKKLWYDPAEKKWYQPVKTTPVYAPVYQQQYYQPQYQFAPQSFSGFGGGKFSGGGSC